jgi:hypothetical protein
VTTIGFDSLCTEYNNYPSIKIVLKKSPKMVNKGKKFEIEIPVQDYVIKQNINFQLKISDISFEKCKLAFFDINIGPPKGPLIVFGLNFLRKIYTVFDFGNKVIGFEFQPENENSQQISDYKDNFVKDEISQLIDNFTARSERTRVSWKRVN